MEDLSLRRRRSGGCHNTLGTFIKPGCNNGDLHLALHGLVKNCAEDDIGFGIGRIMDDIRSLADLVKQEVVATGDVDQHATGALNGGFFQETARNGFLAPPRPRGFRQSRCRSP